MNNLGNIFNINDKMELVSLSKLLNTIYNNYSYLTLDDYNRIDKIDNKIFGIDKQLYFLITGEDMTGLGIIDINKQSPAKLLSKRASLISERDKIIKTSKNRMKKSNPKRYKAISKMIVQQRLAMKNGNIDILKICDM